MFNFRYFFKQIMVMFGCLRCVSHLPSLLKKMTEGLYDESYFLDVQKTFLTRIIWNDHKYCVIPEMRESFTESGNYYRMGAIAKYKSMKNGSMLHDCVIHKKNGQWMVVFLKKCCDRSFEKQDQLFFSGESILIQLNRVSIVLLMTVQHLTLVCI